MIDYKHHINNHPKGNSPLENVAQKSEKSILLAVLQESGTITALPRIPALLDLYGRLDVQ